MPGVGKTPPSGANCPTLANFLLSYTLETEKPGLGSQTARDSQGWVTAPVPTSAPPKSASAYTQNAQKPSIIKKKTLPDL